jgi:hypothetical protein
MKYFIRFRIGWWILHIAAVLLLFYLGHLVRF